MSPKILGGKKANLRLPGGKNLSGPKCPLSPFGQNPHQRKAINRQ